jgi:NAD(P)-dependent dehydrogenase (short-subunit alcohol dehydrogenase family)/acyl carrier protein
MFDKNASYLIAGGLGGIGRGIIRWMVRKGAKHLILPSRSGPQSQAAADAISELTALGAEIVAPKCDVSSEKELAALLTECKETMPPVKGCINAAMDLQDVILSNMTYKQWSASIQAKVQTSWNLHSLLPDNLDFFILLSSLSGIYGSVSQSNYASGCAFQDALAKYRISKGQKAVSFDIGWMRNIGIIAETESYQAQRKNAADMGQIEDTELMAVLDMFCDPSLDVLPESKSQILIGVVTPADLLAQGQDPPPTMQKPLFSGFSRATNGVVGGAKAESPAALFRQASEPEERSDVVTRALVYKLSRSLSIASDEVELSKPLSEYGVDSLMAVELRNWIIKDFQANVAVFDIMSGTPIAKIGDLVVEKSQVGTA